MNEKPSSIVVETLYDLLRLPSWHVQRLHKRDPQLWIFGAWDGERYSDNSRAVFEYVNAHCPAIHAVWITWNDDVLKKVRDMGYAAEHAASPEGRRVMRKAGIFFETKGIGDVDARCLNGCRIVNLWHGMPLKQIGEDAMRFVRRNTWWKRAKTAIRRMVAPHEFIPAETLSTSPFFTPFIQSAFRLPLSKIHVIGLPRNDRFFDDRHEPFLRALDEQFGHPTKVLYMPTHRDAVSRTGRPFDPFDYGFDRARFEAALERGNIVFIYKGHFFDRDNRGATDGRILTVTDDDYDDLYRFAKDVDVLVTDYSSIYFDFLLLRRPVILFPFDEKDYCARSRPFYFDYNLMEARRVTTWDELADCLLHKTYCAPSDEEISRFHTYIDGDCCQRLIEIISRTVAIQ